MSKVKPQILLIFLFIQFLTLGQDKKSVSPPSGIGSHENILTNPTDDTSGVNTLNITSEKYWRTGRYDSAMLFANSAVTLAEKLNFKRGLASAYRNVGMSYYYLGEYTKAKEYHTKGLEINLEIGNRVGIARGYSNIGIIYNDLGDYPTALDYDFKALGMNQEINNKIGQIANLGNIGVVYVEQHNYAKALEYDLKALAIAQEVNDKSGVSINLCNVANVYQNQGNYAKAYEYYFKARSFYDELGDKDGVSAIDHNLGNINIRQGDFSRAEVFFDKALAENRELKNKKGMAENYTDIAIVFYNKEKYAVAKLFCDSAIVLGKELGYKLVLQDAYQSLTSFDTATGDYKNAFEDHKKYIAYRDSISGEDNLRKISQKELQYQFSLKEDSIKAEHQKEMIVKESESRRKSIITGGASIISLLTILLAVVLINRQQIKRKRDKILFERNMIATEQEKSFLKTENQRVEGELTLAKIKLDEYVNSLVEKNVILEKLNEDVEYLKNLKSKEIDEKRIEHLYNLNKVTILTEEDWSKFKDLFDHAYKGFFIRLKEKLPDLTQAEMRLVCLTKLKLDTKQMASILGVSFATIRQTRYRLRKKLGQSEEDSIDDIVESV
ncbi:MAG TPA: tetratricopeptide repeat protein [Bacteroidia bacterium]|nr:tetratricopeptide repeat protein [Bacteroidia bacterium]